MSKRQHATTNNYIQNKRSYVNFSNGGNHRDQLHERLDTGSLSERLEAKYRLADLEYVMLHTGVTEDDIVKKRFEMRLNYMLNEIPNASEAQWHELLKKTFPYLDVTPFRAISIAVLQMLKELPDYYCEKIQKSEVLYDVIPLSIKRKLWVQAPESFEKEINKMLGENVSHFYIAGLDPLQPLRLVESHKDRLDGPFYPQLSKFCEILRNSDGLFKNVNRYLIKQYGHSDYATCTLAYDIYSECYVGLPAGECRLNFNPANQITTTLASAVKVGTLTTSGAQSLMDNLSKATKYRDCHIICAMLLSSGTAVNIICVGMIRYLLERIKNGYGELDVQDKVFQNYEYLIQMGFEARPMAFENKPIQLTSKKSSKFFEIVYDHMKQDYTLDADDDLDMASNEVVDIAKTNLVHRRMLITYGVFLYRDRKVPSLMRLREVFKQQLMRQEKSGRFIRDSMLAKYLMKVMDDPTLGRL